MRTLENVVQPYAWGSRTALAELMGRPSPAPTPEAELWMGAHPAASSRAQMDGGGSVSLYELVRANPQAELGPQVTERFGTDLPFLLKVLAAATPLSLQTHPSLAQAREGFERENASGIPLSAPHRNYKDANHKPELICALTPFDALCGFRAVDATLALFDALALPDLEPLLQPLRAEPDESGLKKMFEGLMSAPRSTHVARMQALAERCAERAKEGGRFALEFHWAAELGRLYPGDPGVMGALLLNCVRLAPGEAIYLPAGNLHAYLKGVGVEIMANSDNVLRGGCTPKHVDVPELLSVLDFRCGPIEPLAATAEEDGEEVYRTPTDEFRLARFTLGLGRTHRVKRRGPEILFCASGHATLSLEDEDVVLASGGSVFVGADEGAFTLEGDGVVYRASSGLF